MHRNNISRPATTGALEVSWLHSDRLASTRILTDTTGAVTGTYSYDAYGKTLTHTGTTTTPLQHNGQYADTESGLTYLRARYYDPTTATFLTLDPAANLSNARYAYASGNPITNTDPLGLWDILDGLESLARSAPATALVNFGRGASGGLTDTLANAISPGASCTVDSKSPQARLFQGAGFAASSVAGGLGANAVKGAAKPFGKRVLNAVEKLPCNCFVAGTKVQTQHGAKPIENINIGDKVWAKNLRTGKNELRPVTGLFRKQSASLMTITNKFISFWTVSGFGV